MKLSTRETEIMKWVAMGKTNPEIAIILGVSIFTVKNHLRAVFNKLGANNRMEAVMAMQKLSPH